MIILYCVTCGTRIDQADVESGAAVTIDDSTYCRKCRVAMDGGKPARTGKARDRKSGRHSSRTGKAGGITSGARPSTLFKAGAALLVAGAVLVGAVFLVKALTGSNNEPKPPPAPDPIDSLDRQIEAVKRVDKKQEEERKEAGRKSALPLKKIEQWREEASKLAGAGDFERALAFWNDVHEKIRKRSVPDEGARTAGTAVAFRDEHLDLVEQEITNVIAAYSRNVKEEIASVENEVEKLCERQSYSEARSRLDKWIEAMPQARRDRFPECMNKAISLKDLIESVEALWKQKRAIEAVRLNSREIMPSESWVDLARSADDFNYNWKTDKGDSPDACARWAEAENCIELCSWPSHATPLFRDGSVKWLDYELEFKVKGQGPMEVHARRNRGGSVCTFIIKASPETKTCLVRVNNVVAELWINGKMEIETLVDVKPGPPMFRARDSNRIMLSEIRLRLLKTSP